MTLLVCAETGGTHTRAALVDITPHGPTVIGAATSTGGNPNTVGLAEARRAWTHTLTSLKVRIPRGETVTAAAVGMGGPDQMVRAEFRSILGVDPLVVSDSTSALWAGSPTGTATVLVAGTGSVATRFRDGQDIGSLGGWGWWLGDEGSGTWLGREVLRMTLAALSAGQGDELTAAVQAELGAAALTAEDIFAYMYADPALMAWRAGRFAPLATSLDCDAAVRIRERAADALADLARPLLDAQSCHLVLSGAVASSSVGALTVTRLREQVPDLAVTTVRHGLLGALVLAARSVDGVLEAGDVAEFQRVAAGVSSL